jgi:hypothetical protein
MASPRRYSHGHRSLGRLNPRRVTARRSASGKENKMENFSIARIIRRSNIGTQVVCEYFGSLDFGNPSHEKRIARELAICRAEEPENTFDQQRRGESLIWHTITF